MQKEEIIKIIDNLKGKRKYEERKATKLGYDSLYEYLENKIFQQKQEIENKEREIELIKTKKKLSKINNKKKTCGCC